MIEFLKILFLAKFILLTPKSVTIDDIYSIKPKETFSAINQMAYVSIDVSNMMKGYEDKDVITKLDALKAKFPNGSVTAKLTSKNGEVTLLTKISYSSALELMLKIPSDAKVGVEYKQLDVIVTTSLTDVTIGWANSK